MYFIIITVILIVFSILFRVYQKTTNAVCSSNKRLDGKTCIVTGGTAGMGLETAKEFAKRGAKVIVACPFEEEGLHAQTVIKEETGNENVVYKYLNLASFKSTREFAQSILSSEKRLDILVNNAGIGAVDKLTEDGLNFTMQINFYGHFLLTILLLPLLAKTGTPTEKSRIVNVASVLLQFGQYFNNMNRLGYWYKYQIYGNSKFCLMLFARELAKRLENDNVVINTVDPGAVGTKIFMKNFGYFGGHVIELCFSYFFNTPREGAQTAIHVAIDESIEGVCGELFRNCSIIKAKKSAYNEETAALLFKDSANLVKLDDVALNYFSS